MPWSCKNPLVASTGIALELHVRFMCTSAGAILLGITHCDSQSHRLLAEGHAVERGHDSGRSRRKHRAPSQAHIFCFRQSYSCLAPLSCKRGIPSNHQTEIQAVLRHAEGCTLLHCTAHTSGVTPTRQHSPSPLLYWPRIPASCPAVNMQASLQISSDMRHLRKLLQVDTL